MGEVYRARDTVLKREVALKVQLLMDEKLGVRIAREQGLAVTGTLGVLVQAIRRGLIDIERALADLYATDFRCNARVMEAVRRLTSGWQSVEPRGARRRPV